MHILVVVALGLIALIGFVRWLEPRLAFFPSAGETTTPQEFGVAFSSTMVPTSDGQQIHAWALRAEQSRGLMVYFHGNGGNLSMWAPIVAEIVRHGYDVLAFDYRGYGVSSGRPTETGLYRDADAVVEYAWRLRRGSEPIVYWGRSLGTAVAAYAATRRAPDGVIIESGFPDARSIFRTDPVLGFLSLFASYRFAAAAALNRAGKPTLVIHGDADDIIPFRLGQALFNALTVPKTFVTIHGGGHNDETPADPATFWSSVDGFIDKINPAPRA